MLNFTSAANDEISGCSEGHFSRDSGLMVFVNYPLRRSRVEIRSALLLLLGVRLGNLSNRCLGAKFASRSKYLRIGANCFQHATVMIVEYDSLPVGHGGLKLTEAVEILVHIIP
ncbi:hypothetical protein AVEN_209931-1 [Araneus ventricosus]|uniref:Uncharacterized protein n=1 Tax=Araneus ventricosus TaxID=182803 RepID=A0A4Y2DER9_ARAVE|nr:hypothetical protein AVEN_209931-1 [Araneus ventricosus]